MKQAGSLRSDSPVLIANSRATSETIGTHFWFHFIYRFSADLTTDAVVPFLFQTTVERSLFPRDCFWRRIAVVPPADSGSMHYLCHIAAHQLLPTTCQAKNQCVYVCSR